jgi:hypothetical protein
MLWFYAAEFIRYRQFYMQLVTAFLNYKLRKIHGMLIKTELKETKYQRRGLIAEKLRYNIYSYSTSKHQEVLLGDE